MSGEVILRRRRPRRARRVRHNLLLGIAATVTVLAVVYLVRERRLVEAFSLGTAYASLLFLAVCLSMGPIKVLRGEVGAASSDLRRDLGIGAALLGTLHTVLGLQVHMKHRWEYFLQPSPNGTVQGLRLDAFGFANYGGVLALLVSLGLWAISSDRALAWLGRPAWKRWQRTSYIAALLVVGHGFVYQRLEHRAVSAVAVMGVTTLVVLTLQLLGRRRWIASRQQSAMHSPSR